MVRARFTPDDGAALVAAVEALVPQRDPVAPPSPAITGGPGRSRHRTGTPPGGGPGRGPPRGRPAGPGQPASRQHDNDRSGGRPREHPGDRPPRRSTGAASLEGGPEVPAATAERLACDTRLQLLLATALPTGCTSAATAASPARPRSPRSPCADRAVCPFPGLHLVTRHLHAQHVLELRVRWSRTDIDNLILICSLPSQGHPRSLLPHPAPPRPVGGPPTRRQLDPGRRHSVDRQRRGLDRGAHPSPAAYRPGHPHPELGRRAPRPGADPGRPAAPRRIKTAAA